MAETEAKKPDPTTVRELFQDPEFSKLPLGEKNTRFEKVRKIDMDFQKMSNDGQEAAHQKLFGPPAQPAQPPTATEGAPSPMAALGTAALDALGKLAPDTAASLKKQFGLEAVPAQTLSTPEADKGISPEAILAGETGPEAPKEPTEPTSFMGTLGKGAVKGLETPFQMAHLAGQAAQAGYEAVGGAPQTPEQQELGQKLATPIQSWITGPLLSPDTPGFHLLEHIVANITGAAIAAPIARALFPSLAAGKTLTKDIVEQAIHMGIAAVPGDVVKQAGGGAVAQIGTEIGSTGITGAAHSIWKAIQGRPAMRNFIVENAKKETPGIAGNIETAERAKVDVPGYNPTMGELTDSPLIGSTAAQLRKDQPTEFGVPYLQQIKGNVDAAIAKVKSVLGLSDEATITKGVGTAQKAALEANAEHQRLAGVHKDLLKESDLLNDAGVQRIRAAQDTNYNTVTKAEGDIRAAEDAATKAKQQADQLVRDSKEKGVELDLAQVKKYRDAEDAARTAKQDAQDTKTRALNDAADNYEGTKGQARTASQEATARTSTLESNLARVQDENAKALEAVTEHQRKTAAKIAPGAAAGEASYQSGRAKLAQAEKDLYRKSYDSTFTGPDSVFSKEYRDVYDTHGITGDDQFKGNFVDAIRKDGAFEQRMIQRMQESYVPEPVLQDMRSYIIEKEAATNRLPKEVRGDASKLESYMNGGTEKPVINSPLNLEEMAGFRSRAMEAQRGMAADNPRRRTLNALVDYLGDSMESMALGEGKPEAIADLRRVNESYRIEILRYRGDSPGKMATAINPRTGQPFYPANYIGDNMFGPMSAGGESLADTRHVEMFKQHLEDLKHAETAGRLAGDDLAVGEAKEVKNQLFDHIKNQFYRAAVDEETGKFNPANAEKWIKTHRQQIDQSPDLKKTFGTMKDRLNAIKEVEAAAQGTEAQARGLAEESAREGKQIKSAGEEAIYQSRREQAAAKRAAGATATTEERAGAAEHLEKKRSFEDIAAQQAETERQATLARQKAVEEGGNQITQARRDAQTAERLSARGTVEEVRTIENLKAAAKEKLQVAAENVKNAAEEKVRLVNEWKKNMGGTGPFTDPLNQDIALQKFGVKTKDFLKRVEGLPIDDQHNAYRNLFAQSKDDPTLIKSVISGMWEIFLEDLRPEQLADTGKTAYQRTSRVGVGEEASLASTFLREKGPLLREYMPEYVKNLELAQEVLDRAARAANATTEGVPSNLKAIPRGTMRVKDVALTIGLRALGVPYRVAGMAGIAEEGLQLLTNAARARIQKEIFTNPDSAALLAKIANPKVNGSWKTAAMKTILFRSGIGAAEFEED